MMLVIEKLQSLVLMTMKKVMTLNLALLSPPCLIMVVEVLMAPRRMNSRNFAEDLQSASAQEKRQYLQQKMFDLVQHELKFHLLKLRGAD